MALVSDWERKWGAYNIWGSVLYLAAMGPDIPSLAARILPWKNQHLSLPFFACAWEAGEGKQGEGKGKLFAGGVLVEGSC